MDLDKLVQKKKPNKKFVDIIKILGDKIMYGGKAISIEEFYRRRLPNKKETSSPKKHKEESFIIEEPPIVENPPIIEKPPIVENPPIIEEPPIIKEQPIIEEPPIIVR